MIGSAQPQRKRRFKSLVPASTCFDKSLSVNNHDDLSLNFLEVKNEKRVLENESIVSNLQETSAKSKENIGKVIA